MPLFGGALARIKNKGERVKTYILDKALLRAKIRQEEDRNDMLQKTLSALNMLGDEIDFKEAYIFGSLTKENSFYSGSDIDIAFSGLNDNDFFSSICFLEHNLKRNIDVIQLENCIFKDKILTRGIKWKKKK